MVLTDTWVVVGLSESHWPWGKAHLQLLSFGVLRITEGGVNPVIVFDTALRCVVRHGEGLTHQRQPADRLHHQLLQVVVWDLLRGREERRLRESVEKPSGSGGVRGRQFNIPISSNAKVLKSSKHGEITGNSDASSNHPVSLAKIYITGEKKTCISKKKKKVAIKEENEIWRVQSRKCTVGAHVGTCSVCTCVFAQSLHVLAKPWGGIIANFSPRTQSLPPPPHSRISIHPSQVQRVMWWWDENWRLSSPVEATPPPTETSLAVF